MTPVEPASLAPLKDKDYAPILANRHALEVCVVLVSIALILGAFLEAFSYEFVSSRTPFVIMVPLLTLLVIQLVRLLKVRGPAQVSGCVAAAFNGKVPAFNKKINLLIWFSVMLFVIVLGGHYAGLTVFVFVMTWFLSKERLAVSLAVTLGTVVAIFLVFELGFDIDLYRGMIFRHLAGYRVF
ncbi:MAG: hypothetical protein RLP08_24890 [Marinovum algicola]|jgi:hypothetical protein|uniref:hypothetical protein n=1 Tax=Marinovum algicola TaxID=42444 RepID=UPI0032EDFA87